MWKKLLAAGIALVGIFTVGYAYFNMKMDASGYSSNGEVTGRIGGTFSKGDRIITDIAYQGNAIDWLLLNDSSQWTNGGSFGYTIPAAVAGTSNGMLALSYHAITNVSFRNSVGNGEFPAQLSTSNLVPIYTQINSSIDSDPLQKSYVLEHNADLAFVASSSQPANGDYANLGNVNGGIALKYTFPPTYVEFDTPARAGNWLTTIYGALSNDDRSFEQPYIVGTLNENGTQTSSGNYVLQDGSFQLFSMDPSQVSWFTAMPLRVPLLFNLTDVVFAVSDSYGTGYNQLLTVENIDQVTGAGSLYDKAGKYHPMKMRVKDDVNLGISFDKITSERDASATNITQAKAGTGLKLYWSGKKSHTANDYVSLLIEKQNTNGTYDFVYYGNLSQDAAGTYVLDTTGWTRGFYKISLVDETLPASNNVTYSSSMQTKNFEILDYQPHTISYQKTVSGGYANDYEYNRNVNAKDTIGKITLTTTPATVLPITYQLEGDGDTSYNNFEIDGLNGNGSSAANTLNVKIKANAPDLSGNSLKAGVYKFCIVSQDADGLPSSPIQNKTRVCTSLTVDKAKLTVAFNDPNQTKKSVTDAATLWNEAATATPNNGVKITYAKVGGDIGLIDIDPDTGEITYKGNGAYGKITIRATADDDPASGDDNYDSAYVEKEIVIYAQVKGSVIPDPKSSDANTPTFTASDANVKTGGTIGTIKGAPGTPDNISGGTITYKYGIKSGGDGSSFTVNSSTGVITTNANLGVGTYHITVTVSDKWSTKDIPVTINVGKAKAENLQFYEPKTSSNVINTKTVKFTDTGVEVYAAVKGSSNNNPVTYAIKDGSTNVIVVHPTSGAVTIYGVGTVTIVATKQGATGQADATAELTFTVTSASQSFIYTTDSTLSKEMPKNSSTGKYNAYEETYAPGKTFNVYTTGNPAGSTVTYRLKAGSSNDVISVDPDGTVHILNASRSTDIGHVSIEATSHDPSGNYADKTIELPITIKRGTRTVSFADDPVYAVNGNGTVTPVINVDGVSDTSKTAVVEVDPNESSTAWTNNGVDIQYSYSGSTGKDVKLSVSLPGNRNYENAIGNGTLHILGANEAMLTVSSPGKIIYGDHFTIRSTQDDSMSTNVQYSFTVNDTTYISNPTVNGKQADFDALKFSGNTETTITVTRTADGELPLSKKIKIKVLPKPITITIEDKNKLKGEVNPPLTVQNFNSQLVSWNGVPDVIQPKDIILNTTATQNSPAGSYPIKGDANHLNKLYPNYTFTFVDGTLKINEENIEDSWYHLETDDGQPYNGNWTNQNVNIISDHPDYVNLSPDQSTWKANFITISKEGNNAQSFWMKKNSGAITGEKKERIKIDKQAPKVKSINAKDSNNKLQDIINKISGGIFFKPGTTFEITTDDSNGKLDVSGTDSIAYKLYKQESDKSYGNPIVVDTLAVTGEKAGITINETVGTYKICVTPTDKAGNKGTESCHEIELKKINVDVDGDGDPDFNDPDGDGCPDLNIKWKDPNDPSKWVVINGDRNNDGIPDLNIDSDGDGKPDLNIDTDNDGRPDLNLVILKKSDWKPTTCVNVDEANGILEEYCTGTTVKPVINVDLDDDGIPDINIDNKGDFKPHLNISKDGKTPSVNIIELHEWKPNKNYQSGKFSYDSLGNSQSDPQPEINIDTDGDGLPDINIDLDGDGYPDINKDIDGDGIPDIDIDSTGDGTPDVNVDNDGDGKPDENIIEVKEWKPEHNVDGEFPYDTMTSFDDPKKPDEPEEPSEPNTDVKGAYYPGDNAGGANGNLNGGALTGDTTNIMLYIGMGSMAMGILLYLAYKRKQNE